MLLSAKPVYRQFKLWRALNLAESGIEILEVEDTESVDINAAWEKTRAAYALAPDDIRIVRALARVLAIGDPALAVLYWEQAVGLSRGAEEDRMGLIEAALLTDRISLAENHLNILVAQGVENLDLKVLEGRLMAAQNKLPEAIRSFQSIIKEYPDLPSQIHFFYVQLCSLSSNEVDRLAGIDHLHTLSQRKDRLGLVALRRLAKVPTTNPSDIKSVVSGLKDHELATREDFLLALELELDHVLGDLDEIIRDVRNVFDENEGAELASLGRWLNQHRLHEQTMEVIPLETALKRQDLLLIRLDAMAMLGKWVTIRSVLERKDIILEGYLLHLFRMRVFLRNGDDRRADIEWGKVLIELADDEERLWYVADYALRLNMEGYARSPLKLLTQFPSSMRKASEHLIRIEQRSGDTVALRDLMVKMSRTYKDEPAILNDIAYLNILLGKDVDLSVAQAEKMVKKNPDYLSHWITLALGRIILNDHVGALKALELPVDWTQVRSRWRIVKAYVLSENGRTEEARKLLTGLEEKSLLPEERKMVIALGGTTE